MKKTLSLLAGAAILASVGSAIAAEMLTAVQMDDVTAAGTRIRISKIVYDHFVVRAYVNPYVRGNTAQAVAEADAYGYNTFTLATSATHTNWYSSSSQATSTSITD